LFLAAGAVIHAVGTQDLLKMGGLRKPMAVTAVAFAIGGLSLSGIPPFAGFFSKDDILSSVYGTLGAHPLYWPFFLLAFATVFLTAYYIFRAWFLAFSGEHARDPAIQHPHEAPWVMRAPLIVLSALAVAAGTFEFFPQFRGLLPGLAAPSFDATSLGISAVSVALGLSGIALAWLLWGNGRVFALPSDSPAQPVRSLLLNRYYFKAAYDAIGLKGVYALSRAADFVETYVIDGTIRGIQQTFARLSDGLRRLQTGIVSDYAAYVVSGLVGLFLMLLFIAPWIVSHVGGG
jgi:NADH-quinone oxidoreductase subunit L